MLQRSHTIKKYITILIIAPCLSATVWAESEQPISYANAMKRALNYNPSVQSSKASVEAAYGALKQTNSLHWPRAELEINGARSNNPLSVFGYKLSQGNASFADFGAEQYTGLSALYTRPNALNHPGYYSNLDTAFKLTVPIYAGGKIKARQENTRALLLSAQHGSQQAQNQLAYQLYVSYEGFLTAIQLIHVAQKQVDRAKEFLNTTKALKKQSITLDSDELMAEDYLNSSSLGLSSARLQAQNELDNFRTLIGEPNSNLTPSQHTTLKGQTGRLNSLISHALGQNASIKALRSQVQAEKANILASQSLYKPQVNLQLRHDWNGYTVGSGLPSDTIALGANWTLFSAGERSGAVQSATANAKKAQFELDEQRNQLKLLLKQLTRNATQFNYELQLSRQMIQKEEEVIKKLSQRFGRGSVPLSALLESQIKLTQSKAQELQALHRLRLNKAHILMLTNQLIPNTLMKA